MVVLVFFVRVMLKSELEECNVLCLGMVQCAVVVGCGILNQDTELTCCCAVVVAVIPLYLRAGSLSNCSQSSFSTLQYLALLIKLLGFNLKVFTFSYMYTNNTLQVMIKN